MTRSIAIAIGLAMTSCLLLAACFQASDHENQTEGLAICAPIAVAGVTASGNDGNVPQNVLDGNLSTRWSSFGVGQFITADLGATKTVCSVAIAWYRGNLRSSNFVISVSTDGTAYTQVYSGTSSGTTTALDTYDVPDAAARYVRVTVNGNTENGWASITELAVSGASTSSQPETLFGNTAPASSDAADLDTGAVELGVRFTAAVSGKVSAIRFYRAKANSAGYSVHLWTSTGTLLANASGNDGTLPGWRLIALPGAVSISANTTYVASYFTSNGGYAGTNGGFSTAMTSGDLTAPVDAGVYRYGTSPGFPASTYQSSNYWVDVSFVPGSPSSSDTTPPTVSITSPANGSTVSGTITVSANASDNVGVAGVQFLLDGASLGTEDTSSPYSTGLSSGSVSNGSHTLTARARDGAGNITVSAPITIAVSTPTSSTGYPYPNASNTGVPAGTNLTPYTGPNPVTADGTTISGVVISGTLTVRANNVTVKNSKVLGGSIYGPDSSNYGLVVQDTEIDGQNTTDSAVAVFGSYTLLRVNAHGRSDGVDLMGTRSVVLQDCYIHGLSNLPGDHGDGVQFYKFTLAPGGSVKMIHNTIEGGNNAAIMPADWSFGDLYIDGNLLMGGGYVLRLYDMHAWVTNNLIYDNTGGEYDNLSYFGALHSWFGNATSSDPGTTIQAWSNNHLTSKRDGSVVGATINQPTALNPFGI